MIGAMIRRAKIRFWLRVVEAGCALETLGAWVRKRGFVGYAQARARQGQRIAESVSRWRDRP